MIYQLTRYEYIKFIEFRNGQSIENIQNLVSIDEGTLSGDIILKEFSYSFDNTNWTSWQNLTNTALNSIKFTENQQFYIDIKYYRNSVESGNIEDLYLVYNSTSNVSISESYINADYLNSKPGSFYLDRSNHTGALSGGWVFENSTNNNFGAFLDKIDTCTGTTVIFRNLEGSNSVKLSESKGIIKIDTSVSFETINASINDINSKINVLDSNKINGYGLINTVAFWQDPCTITFSSSFQYDGGYNTLILGDSSVNTFNPEAFIIDNSDTNSNTPARIKGNINDYFQLELFNKNDGSLASSDIVIAANNSNELINYIDVGINGENYTENYVGTSNDAYLYSTGNNLIIGNATEGKDVIIFTNSPSAYQNERLRITSDGSILINKPISKVYLVEISGDINIDASSNYRINGNSIKNIFVKESSISTDFYYNNGTLNVSTNFITDASNTGTGEYLPFNNKTSNIINFNKLNSRGGIIIVKDGNDYYVDTSVYLDASITIDGDRYQGSIQDVIEEMSEESFFFSKKTNHSFAIVSATGTTQTPPLSFGDSSQGEFFDWGTTTWDASGNSSIITWDNWIVLFTNIQDRKLCNLTLDVSSYSDNIYSIYFNNSTLTPVVETNTFLTRISYPYKSYIGCIHVEGGKIKNYIEAPDLTGTSRLTRDRSSYGLAQKSGLTLYASDASTIGLTDGKFLLEGGSFRNVDFKNGIYNGSQNEVDYDIVSRVTFVDLDISTGAYRLDASTYNDFRTFCNRYYDYNTDLYIDSSLSNKFILSQCILGLDGFVIIRRGYIYDTILDAGNAIALFENTAPTVSTILTQMRPVLGYFICRTDASDLSNTSQFIVQTVSSTGSVSGSSGSGGIAGANNIGTGGDVYQSTISNILQLRRINTGTQNNIIITQLSDELTIDASVKNYDGSINDLYLIKANQINVDSSLTDLYNKNISQDSSISRIDSSLNFLIQKNNYQDTSLNNLILYIDSSLTDLYNKNISQDSSISNLRNKDIQIDGSLNYLYNKTLSLDGSISQIDLSINNLFQITNSQDSSIQRIDTSLSNLYNKDISQDSSIINLRNKDIQIDGSLNYLYNKDIQTDGSLNYLYNKDIQIDGSLNDLYNKNISQDSSIQRIDSSILLILSDINNIDISLNKIDASVNYLYNNDVTQDASITYLFDNKAPKLNYIIESSLGNTLYWNLNNTLDVSTTFLVQSINSGGGTYAPFYNKDGSTLYFSTISASNGLLLTQDDSLYYLDSSLWVYPEYTIKNIGFGGNLNTTINKLAYNTTLVSKKTTNAFSLVGSTGTTQQPALSYADTSQGDFFDWGTTTWDASGNSSTITWDRWLVFFENTGTIIECNLDLDVSNYDDNIYSIYFDNTTLTPQVLTSTMLDRTSYPEKCYIGHITVNSGKITLYHESPDLFATPKLTRERNAYGVNQKNGILLYVVDSSIIALTSGHYLLEGASFRNLDFKNDIYTSAQNEMSVSSTPICTFIELDVSKGIPDSSIAEYTDFKTYKNRYYDKTSQVFIDSSINNKFVLSEIYVNCLNKLLVRRGYIYDNMLDAISGISTFSSSGAPVSSIISQIHSMLGYLIIKTDASDLSNTSQFNIQLSVGGSGTTGSSTTAGIIDINNIGSGSQIYKQTISNIAQLRSLSPGTQNNIIITQQSDNIIIDASIKNYDISINNIDSSLIEIIHNNISQDASIVRIDSSIVEIINHNISQDSSISILRSKDVTLDASIVRIDSSIADTIIKNNYQDVSLNNLILYVDGSLNNRVKITGDTMTGDLVVPNIRTVSDISVGGTLYLRKSTTSSNTALISMTDGSLMSSPEANTIEYSNNNLYFTDASIIRQKLLTESYGQLYLDSSAGVAFSVATVTWNKYSNTNVGLSSLISCSSVNSNMTLSSGANGIYSATVNISGIYGTNNRILYGNIYLNGVPAVGMASAKSGSNAAQDGVKLSLHTILHLHDGDILDVRLRDAAGTGTLTVNSFSFILNRIGKA